MSLYPDLLDTAVSRERRRRPRKTGVLYAEAVFRLGLFQAGSQRGPGDGRFHCGAVGAQRGGVGGHGRHAAIRGRRVRLAAGVRHRNATLWKKKWR